MLRSGVKILYIGDVSTRRGRESLKQIIPQLKQKHSPDFIIANIENAAGGRGVTHQTYTEILGYGIDLATAGDHVYSLKSFLEQPIEDLAFIRPANYESNLPGKQYEVVEVAGQKVAFIVLLGQDMMQSSRFVRNPFFYVDQMLEQKEIAEANHIVIEVHAETGTEKLALAWYLKDRVSAVVGTHTHVATADNRLLGEQVAYVTDIGQVGPYDASLWADFENVINNFKYPMRKPFEMAENGPIVFNSVLITLDSKQNLSPLSIERVDIVVE